MKAKLRILCTNDFVFSFLCYTLMRKYTAILADDKRFDQFRVGEGRMKTLMMRMRNIAMNVEEMVFKLDGIFCDAIREGRVRFSPEPNMEGKGGELVIEMEGLEEEIDNWTTIKLRQKVAMAGYRHMGFSFNVEKEK